MRLSGWWQVLDRGLPVLPVIVLVMSVDGLFRDDLPSWWVLSVAAMVLAGTGTRWVIERHRRGLAAPPPRWEGPGPAAPGGMAGPGGPRERTHVSDADDLTRRITAGRRTAVVKARLRVRAENH